MVKILFKNLNGRQWLMILVCLVLIVGQVRLDLLLPDYMGEITTAIQTAGSKMSDILIPGGMMLLCALGSVLLAICTGFIVAQIAAAFSRKVRQGVFDKVESFSMEELNRFSTASLITRTTNDVQQIQMFIAMGLQALIKAPILAVWAVLEILNKSWQLSLLTAIAVAVIVIMITFMAVFVIPRFRKIQTLTDNLNRVTRENLTGLRVVRAYNAEGFQEGKFDGANKELVNTYMFTTRFMAILQPVITLVMSTLSLGIYWVGSTLVNEASLLDKTGVMSNVMSFSIYAALVIQAFMMISMIFIMLPRAMVSAKRINEVMNTRPSITFNNSVAGNGNLCGEVEFKNVSFKYPNAEEYILKDISFKANRGETVAFIGSTGSGKSTLINLIPRFYDATEGEVIIDGINVKDYSQSGLYNKLGYVPQKGVLFSGTVKDNVSFGEAEFTHEEDDIWSVLETAQAKDFVGSMDGKLEAHIAQGGTNVSGGQKQRLSIARAVARKPEIYIFDDTFSALDYKTDKLLRSALKKVSGDATVFIVAQRIGTIMNADKIIVLEQGRLAGIGKHDELIETCAVYREIAQSQLSKEELLKGGRNE